MFSDWRLRGFTLGCLVGLVLIILAYQNTQTLVKNWLSVMSVSQQEWNWQASTLVREHLRFIVAVESYVNQDQLGPVELEHVVERFDLYWSRYTALRSFFTSTDAETMVLLSRMVDAPEDVEVRVRQIVEELNQHGFAILQQLEPIVVSLQPNDTAAYKTIMQKLRFLGDNAVELESELFTRTRLLQFSQDSLTETLNERLRIAYIGLCLVIFTLVTAIYAYVMIKNRAARSLESVNSQLLSKIAESEELTLELKRAANHDSLTGILNRHGFERLLEDLFDNADRMHGLCFVDLDMFKVVNDTCGHAAGDRLIQQVAELFVREFDSCGHVARFGGDEFVLVWPDCGVEEFHDRMLVISNSLSPLRFQYEHQSLEVTASFGAFHFHAGKHSRQSAMAFADAACYEAKNSGGGRVYFHDGDDSVIASRQSDLFWINAVQRALKEDRFLLFHQPIVGICQQGVSQHGWEILVRMCDEKGNVIPPAEFLDVAERYGLAPRVDRWVVRHAFEWLDRNCLSAHGLECLNINLSGLSVSDLEFLDFIEELTARARFDPAKVCFELTETAVAGKKSCEFLRRLKEMGYQLALDDFGSGFASFGYLESLPVDYIKIDGQFVKDIDSNSMHREFVKAIGAIGKAMNKLVVAEFVENEASLSVLRELGIDYAQGYYIARPAKIPDTGAGQLHYRDAA